MNTSKKCEGKTKLGNCCKKKCLEGSNYCELHKNQSSSSGDNSTTASTSYYNEECPICFSSTGQMHLTPCMHQIHIDCAKGMNNLECPLCMTPVSNYPRDVAEQIKSNGVGYQNKLDREDFENFIAHQNEADREAPTIHVSPPLRIEIMSAIHFLLENGIPIEYIPTSVEISIFQDNPTFPQGTLFYAIVGHSIEKVTKDMEDLFDSGHDESESEDDEDDEENPFPNENIREFRAIDIKIL